MMFFFSLSIDCFSRSLCYQFPAVYKEEGLSLVISPLLALIQDQVQALNEKQIVARTLNSTLSQQEKKIVLGDLMQRQPTTRLLYITPELAATQSKNTLLRKLIDVFGNVLQVFSPSSKKFINVN